MIHEPFISNSEELFCNLENLTQCFLLLENTEFDEQLAQADWTALCFAFQETVGFLRKLMPISYESSHLKRVSLTVVFLSQLLKLLRSIYFHSDYYYTNANPQILVYVTII